MSIHVTRAPTVPRTSYDTKRSSHLKFEEFHSSRKYEVVIVIEIPIVISKVIFGVETESGLRIAPSRQVFEKS